MNSNIVFLDQEEADGPGRECERAEEGDKKGAQKMGGNRVRSVTTMRLQHPSTQQDPGARYLQEDITAAIPGLPTKHSQLQVFTPGTKMGAISS